MCCVSQRVADSSQRCSVCLMQNVTVIDFTQGQLDGDIAAAKHYGYEIETLRLNIRDLSAIEDASYDLVYQGTPL